MDIEITNNLNFYVENTKGWAEKSWLGIGRAYNMWGELEVIYIDLIIWRFGLCRTNLG